MASAHLVVDAGRAAFVDAGTSFTTPMLLATLSEQGLDVGDVDWVLTTHVHLDHAGGAGTLMRALPNATLVVHPRGARHLIDPSKLIAGATAIYGEAEMARVYGEIAATASERVIEAPDGFEVRLGDRTLRFLDTPGHARHHYCVHDTLANVVFTGDSFGLSHRFFDTEKGPWLVPTTTPVHFDPPALHATFDRLAGLGCEAAYLTHWGRVDEPTRRVDALHRRLDRMVALLEAAAGKSDLEDALWRFYFEELDAHGVALSEAQLRTLLEVDVSLNADGMLWWRKTRN